MLQRIATCVLLLTAFAAAETFEDRQTKTFDFKPGTTLRFAAEYGHLDVRTGLREPADREAEEGSGGLERACYCAAGQAGGAERLDEARLGPRRRHQPEEGGRHGHQAERMRAA